MIPNITPGTRVVGLMTLLAGDGRANEHTPRSDQEIRGRIFADVARYA